MPGIDDDISTTFRFVDFAPLVATYITPHEDALPGQDPQQAMYFHVRRFFDPTWRSIDSLELNMERGQEFAASDSSDRQYRIDFGEYSSDHTHKKPAYPAQQKLKLIVCVASGLYIRV